MDERRYEALKRRINREYAQAERELREKLEEFFAKSAERDKEKRKLLADGKITKQEYQRWLRGQVFQGKRWQEKIDQAARQLTQVDETATAIVNGERLNVFADNMNYQNKEAERIIGARFDLYDSATVARLLDEQPNLLPPRRVKRSDDIPWYHKLISNCVTQGILQGESVPQIARRIGEQTGERGRKAMLRNARTAVTSAQNAGRMEAMHRQEDMGIRVQKKWIAAIDNRTRRAHQELNGQTVDVDAPFQSILGEILFPGDPAAHPANVYNCRCRLGYVYPEYENVEQDKPADDERGTENEVRAEEAENREREQGVVKISTQNQKERAYKLDRRAEPKAEKKVGTISYDAFMESARAHFNDEELEDFQKELKLYIKSMSGDTKKLAAYLDRLEDLKWTEDAPLYRGIGVSGDVYKKLLQEYKPGREVSMRNISWSTSEASAQQMAQFKGGNQIIFVDESTGKRDMISIEEFTRKNMGDWLANAGHEVLQTKPDESFAITQVITNGNLTFVYVKKKEKRGASNIELINDEKNSKMQYERTMFRSYADPLREAIGSAEDSNPEEMNAIINRAKELGVSIIDDGRGMAYAPGLHKGEPGQLHISSKDSYGAWKHEQRHMEDDAADGFPGYRALADIDRCIRMETAAYNEEIKIAEKLGRTDIVERLKKLLEEEINYLLGVKDREPN